VTVITQSCFCNCRVAAGICLLRLRRVIEAELEADRIDAVVSAVADVIIEFSEPAVTAVAADASDSVDKSLAADTTVEIVLIDD
jgi:hypothetical protein